MVEEITTESNNLNSCDEQSICTRDLAIPVSSTGILIPESVYGSFYEGTTIFNCVGETTGTYFLVDFIGHCIRGFNFQHYSYKESILNFINIMNNKDGWSLYNMISV